LGEFNVRIPLRALQSAIVIVLLPLGVVAQAENAADVMYVTDELRLGLYAGEQTTGTPFKTLLSGAQLVVLEHSLRSVLVRTEAGDEGWVKSGYTVTEEPARCRIVALEEDIANLRLTLRETETAALAASGRTADLESQLTELTDAIHELDQLKDSNSSLLAQLDTQGINLAWHWLVLVLLVAVAAGCGAGYWWLDRRVRKQFAGIRVY
jgi:hypothetical protein